MENLTLLMESKLDAIVEEKYKQEQEIEKLKEELERSSNELTKKKTEKAAKLARAKEINEQLRKTEARLAEVDEALKEFKSEAASVERMVENIPKLSQTKSLMYAISRLTFDDTKKENLIKGFVINPIKEDVSTFTFNTDNKDQSSHFITNYIWDMIGAGVSDEWRKFK